MTVLQPLKRMAWRIRDDIRRRSYLRKVKAGNRRFDYWLGTDTAGVQTSTHYPALSSAINPKARYEPVNEGGLRTIIECVAPDQSFYSFFDIGSGKGKALLIAANYAFEQVVGVEFDAELHEIARQNLASAERRIGRRCGEIRSVHQDALEFDGYSRNSVVFLYSSFHDDLLKCFADRLEEHAVRASGQTILVYLEPTQPEHFEKSRAFSEITRTPRIAIYATEGFQVAPDQRRRLEDAYTGWRYVPGQFDTPEHIVPLYGQGPRGR